MSNYAEQFKLNNKVSLVTGGAQGIGAEVVRALSDMGATVVITDRDVEQGEKLANELQAKGANATFIKLDVTSEKDWEEAISVVDKTYGRLDTLVNNAGILFHKSVEDTTLEQFQLLQSINVDGVFLGCKVAAKLMKQTGTATSRASVINMSSLGGLTGSQNGLAYNTSKGAVRIMTKALAAEFGPEHVRANSVHPGLIQTDMGDQVQQAFAERLGTDDIEQAKAAAAMMVPLRVWGSPKDIALAVGFLASDASNYMSGSEMVIDGGIYGCM